MSQDEYRRSTRNSVLTLPSRTRAAQWSANRMDATLIAKHFNPLKKLREVLMACRRGRSAELCRNEQKRVSEMSSNLHNCLQPRSQSLTCNSLWGNIRNRTNMSGSVFKVRGCSFTICAVAKCHLQMMMINRTKTVPLLICVLVSAGMSRYGSSCILRKAAKATLPN